LKVFLPSVLAVILGSASVQPALAQSGPFFYGNIVIEIDPQTRAETTHKRAMIGLHPTSAEIARQNACARVTGGQTILPYTDCLDSKAALRCAKGGYFAIVDTQLSVDGKVSNAAGVVCGKATMDLAKSQALAACEKTRLSLGLPLVANGYGNWPCRIHIAALNDGNYSEQVLDVPAMRAKAADPSQLMWSIESQCFGKERYSDWRDADNLAGLCQRY
jgi:hypothetical protein